MNKAGIVWCVVYTEDTYHDLQRILNYIQDELLEPETAANQVDRIMDAADSLDHMPYRYRLYDKEPWRSKGLRLMPIDKFIIFYMPIETGAKRIVVIIRVMHSDQNADDILNDYTISDDEFCKLTQDENN